MRRCSGFTWIELLTSLAVLAIVLVFGLAAGTGFYQKNRLDLVSDDIKSALRHARLGAFKQDQPLTINPLPGPRGWSEGLVLFPDNPGHHYSATDSLIYQWRWNYPGITVAWHGFRTRNYLIFSTELRQSTANGYFLIATQDGYQKKLVVNRLGHVRIHVL